MLSKDTWVLAVGQALTATVFSLLTSVSSLSGAYLAPYPALATLPVTASTLGTMLMIYFASTLMGAYGRRTGFIIKALLGMTGSLMGMTGLLLHCFVLLITGCFLLGLFSAFGQYYRFAALESVKRAEDRNHTLALVMGAGVIGGILGPFLGSSFFNLFSRFPYSGAFLALFFVCLLLLISQMLLSPELGSQTKNSDKIGYFNGSKHLQTTVSFSHSHFWYITLIASIAAATMTLIMTAAPLAMHKDHYSVHASSIALQLHFALMYLPSFIQPRLLRYMGHRWLTLSGAIIGAMGSIVVITTPPNLSMYIIVLGMAGMGWSFMTNGSTLLLSSLMKGTISAKIQGVNTTIIYLASLVAALAAGVILSWGNWHWVNLIALFVWLLAIPLIIAIRDHQRT